MTTEAQPPLPFVLRAFAAEQLAGDPSRTTEVIRLKHRNYCLIRAVPWDLHRLDPGLYGGHIACWAGPSSSPEQAPSPGKTAPLPVRELVRDVVELSDAQAVEHFVRIYSGDFPWADLNACVVRGVEAGHVTAPDLDLWDEYIACHLEFDQVFDEKEKIPAESARAALNGVLLWMVAADFAWGFEASDEVLAKLGTRNLTLGYFLSPLQYGIKLVVDDRVTRWKKKCWTCGGMYLEEVRHLDNVEEGSGKEEGDPEGSESEYSPGDEQESRAAGESCEDQREKK